MARTNAKIPYAASPYLSMMIFDVASARPALTGNVTILAPAARAAGAEARFSASLMTRRRSRRELCTRALICAARSD